MDNLKVNGDLKIQNKLIKTHIDEHITKLYNILSTNRESAISELQKIIIDLRYSDYIAPYSIKYGNMMQKLESYKWLMNKCEMINNSNHTNDLFWKYLTKIIVKKNITSFDKKNVYNINKYLVSK
jgi:hypothetical protein